MTTNELKEFYQTNVLRSFQDFITSLSDEDMLYYGRHACEEAYHMADRISNSKQLINTQAYHAIPYSNNQIHVNQHNYKKCLAENWPCYAIITAAANAKKHVKVMKAKYRKKWLQDEYDPETSYGAITVFKDISQPRLSITLNKAEHNLSEALVSVVTIWPQIISELEKWLS
ncbi:MAG: hypothetical protein K0S63_570 [Gammaproteobacteria bacterium]|jgi:hypothetical protein|nr:hypothetical protein [Gammaproteobacteria bacterium]